MSKYSSVCSIFTTGCNISSLKEEQRSAWRTFHCSRLAQDSVKHHLCPTCSGHCTLSREEIEFTCKNVFVFKVYVVCLHMEANKDGGFKVQLKVSWTLPLHPPYTHTPHQTKANVLFIFLPLSFPQWMVMMSTSSTGGSSASTCLASRRGSSLRRLSSGSTRTLFRSALRTRPSDLASTRCCKSSPTGTKDPIAGGPKLPPHLLSQPVAV